MHGISRAFAADAPHYPGAEVIARPHEVLFCCLAPRALRRVVGRKFAEVIRDVENGEDFARNRVVPKR